MKTPRIKYRCGIDCKISIANPGYHCVFFRCSKEWVERTRIPGCPADGRQIREKLINIATLKYVINYTSEW